MKIYKAESQFSSVLLCTKDTNVFEYTYYTCPQCNCKMRFSEHDFHRYELNRTTKYKGVFSDSFVEKNNSFLEFECPGCKIKTRIYFAIYYGDKFPNVKIGSVITE